MERTSNPELQSDPTWGVRSPHLTQLNEFIQQCSLSRDPFLSELGTLWDLPKHCIEALLMVALLSFSRVVLIEPRSEFQALMFGP